ncbi:MAG: hypothetical protein K2M55_07875, partial [Muribaculaceae bacterium]|nr:hypothetical protein [Muribaculaceae bacterium]
MKDILNRRRLWFNPYSVSDARLIEIVSQAWWGSELDITQAVIVRFTRLRPTGDVRQFDGIYMQVGKHPEEIFIHNAVLTMGISANDSHRHERTWVGKRRIYTDNDVAALVGKTYFVSRIIHGIGIGNTFRAAYRMHRLSGKTAKDATIIREAMCAAKVEMLERLLTYPPTPESIN